MAFSLSRAGIVPAALLALLLMPGSPATAGQPHCQSYPDDDTTPPEPPVITSTEFPDDGSWLDMVGEYGSFEFSSPSRDVVRYRYDFNKDEHGPAFVDAGPNRTAAVRFIPAEAGLHRLSVKAFDCAVNSSTESSYTFTVATGRAAAGAWNLADPAGSGQAADADGDHPATAGPGVTFGVDGPRTGTAAELDGTAGAHLTTTADSLVDTDEGFAATAWVRLADLAADRVAVSVDGSREAGFTLGYSAAEQAWSFEIPKYDSDPFTRWRVTSGPGTVEAGEWAHLAGVYDAGSRELRLYVNGELVDSGERGSSWNATGPVQIGQGRDDGQHRGQWHGRLAEVSVFDRIVFQDEIASMAQQPVERTGYWQLNEAPAGQSPEFDGGQPLIVNGGTIYQQADPFFDPRPLIGTGHLELDGVDDYAATASPVVDTSGSFSVAVRVRLESSQPSRSMTVVSAPGANTDLFQVRYSPAADAWELVLSRSDTAGAETVAVTSPVGPSAGGLGQHIAVVYNATTDQAMLYVDGVAAVLPEPFSTPWAASGGLLVGRSLSGGDAGSHLAGAVDELRAYTGALDSATVQRLVVAGEQPDL